MVDRLYDLLANIGFIHPLHPPFTHGPIGAVIVAFLLGLASWRWPKRNLPQSAYHAIVVALFLYLPTVLAGLLDWRHYFSGALIMPIKIKIALAVLLLLLLAMAVVVGRYRRTPHGAMMGLYSLCLCNVLALGYFGGKLVYEGRMPQTAESRLPGRKIFVKRCSGCHTNGGNILYPNLPLRTAPQLENYERFLAFVRQPLLPNGEPGPMPAFTRERLSDREVRQLYDFLIDAFAEPSRHGKPR